MAILSYAQNREDVLLHRLFSDRTDGFYIDVGACHPVIHSVTKLFYDRGWRGINVEPIPALCDQLAQDRPRDVSLHVGLSNREGTFTFYECPPSMELSTFSEEQAGELRRMGFDLVEHAIPVTTLARVCEQHARGTIDFLKVDVESYEREVLEGADWARHRPRVVVVEATRPATNIPSHEDWESLLLAADYLFASFDGLNRYYVRAEDRALLPLLGVPVNVFDDYELHEHHRRLEESRLEIEAARRSLEQERAAREAARAALDEATNHLGIARRDLEESRLALRRTRAELDEVRGELAPFRELGPIAISIAQRLRRMSVRSPKLAAMAKWMIRRGPIAPRVLSPDA